MTSSSWSTHREAETRTGRQGRTAERLARRDLAVLDELGYLPPSPIPAGSCRLI